MRAFFSKLYHVITHLNDYPILYHGQKFYLVAFGLFAALGTFFGTAIFATYVQSKGINFQYSTGLWIILVLVLMMVVSKILHPFVIGKDFFKSPLKYLKQTAFYNQGGQLGVLLALAIAAYFENISLLTLLDATCYAYCFALIIGRIGCYNYGCCYGKITKSAFAVRYTNPDSKVLRLHPELNNVPLIPTQLISAGFDLFLFIVLTIIYFIEPNDGIIALIFIACYNLFRMFIHRFRANDTKFDQSKDSKVFLILSIFFSLSAIIAMIIAIFYYDALPHTATYVPLSLQLFFTSLFDLNNLIPILIISIVVFFAYGYHTRLGEHF